MPNWAYSTLDIHGETSELKKFKEFAKSSDGERDSLFDFNKFIPMPKELRTTTKGSNHVENQEYIRRFGADNWYDWSCDNWGTKWNACDVYADDNEEGRLFYTFETAWSRISDKLWEAIKNKFPTLVFEFSCDEEGGFFYSDTIDGAIVDTEGEREREEDEDE